MTFLMLYNLFPIQSETRPSKYLTHLPLFILMTFLISTVNQSEISICRYMIIEQALMLHCANSTGMKLPFQLHTVARPHRLVWKMTE